jgi:hypothetical protein
MARAVLVAVFNSFSIFFPFFLKEKTRRKQKRGKGLEALEMGGLQHWRNNDVISHLPMTTQTRPPTAGPRLQE